MHRAGLNHRAARGGESPEAAAAVLLPRRSGAARLRGVGAARRLQRPQDAGDAVGVGARVQGAQAGLVEVHPGAQVVQAPAVEQHAGVDRLAALDPRHDADHGVLERVPRHGDRLQICRAGRGDPSARAEPGRPVRDRLPQRRQPRVPGVAAGQQARDVGVPDLRRVGEAGHVQPAVGDERDRGPDQLGGQQRRERGIGRVEIGGPAVEVGAEQHVRRRVVGPRGPRRHDVGRLRARPPVVEGQRGAVVDEVRRTVPAQHVDVAPGAVHVADERVEPQHPPREPRVDRERAGVEVERSGQEVHAQVQAGAAAQQVLDLLVRLRDAERRVQLDRHQLRDRQPQPAGQLSADHLRDEHRQALPGAGVLDDVGAEVVGLHQARQRPALTQRRDVPDGRDVAQRGGRHPRHDRISGVGLRRDQDATRTPTAARNAGDAPRARRRATARRTPSRAPSGHPGWSGRSKGRKVVVTADDASAAARRTCRSCTRWSTP